MIFFFSFVFLNPLTAGDTNELLIKIIKLVTNEAIFSALIMLISTN